MKDCCGFSRDWRSQGKVKELEEENLQLKLLEEQKDNVEKEPAETMEGLNNPSKPNQPNPVWRPKKKKINEC